MKLVGGDSGYVEHEQFVDDVVLAPSERVVVDVSFDRAGELALEHRTPERVYRLASIDVKPDAAPSLNKRFETLRTNADMDAERQRIAPYLDAAPHKTLAFLAEMDFDAPAGEGPVAYACPMHPDVVDKQPGHCPKCGMKLMPVEAPAATYTCPMHPEVVAEQPGHCPKCGMKLLPSQLVAEADGHAEHAHDGHGDHGHCHGEDGHDHATAGGIEWEDDMVEVNRLTTPSIMRWKSSTATPAPRTERSTGASVSATRSRSGCSTRSPATIRCTTPSMFTGRAAS